MQASLKPHELEQVPGGMRMLLQQALEMAADGEQEMAAKVLREAADLLAEFTAQVRGR